MRNSIAYLVPVASLVLCASFAFAQSYYPPEAYSRNSYGYDVPAEAPRPWPPRPDQIPEQLFQRGPHVARNAAEQILQEQMRRTLLEHQVAPQAHAPSVPPEQVPQPQNYGYDSYYHHGMHGQDQVRLVMAEAEYISSILRRKTRKPFIVIDKRNFQFYLYNGEGKLLRIGPVAIGKGRTHVGSFETKVGIYPIKAKVPVDDWIRPDWYYIEEGEPIPQRWEDRRVPGFFRYKLVIQGTQYIHYAEATGGRLTHGCLGLDWEDAEAVYHTLDVGSPCIVIDQPFLARLEAGEFPVTIPKPRSKDKKKAKQEEKGPTMTAKAEPEETPSRERVFSSMW